jgi:FkbM family methyltransferase
MRVLRTLQSYAPALRPLKFGVYNALTQYLGWHMEAEFKLLSRLPKTELAVDIGGNWGSSILALKSQARPARIVSFEPNPAMSVRLSRVFAKDATVQIEACALSEAPGELTLYVPRYGDFVYDGLASLDKAEARDWLNPDRMAWFDPAKLALDEYRVPVRTLDSYGFAPDVVKIDVQGLETEVVRGGLETFRRSHPVTIVEVPTPELVALFKTLDMDAYRWRDGRLIPDEISDYYNTVFLHRDRFAQMGFSA